MMWQKMSEDISDVKTGYHPLFFHRSCVFPNCRKKPITRSATIEYTAQSPSPTAKEKIKNIPSKTRIIVSIIITIKYFNDTKIINF